MGTKGFRHRGLPVSGLVLALVLGAEVASAGTPPDLYRIPDLRALQNTFADLAERVAPSVVSVRTYRYLRLPYEGAEGAFAKSPHSFGSGVVVRPNGYILTNQHVLADADLIKVVLYNGREYEAELVQADIRSDLAVVRIEAKPLRAVSMGDVADLRVGHWCFAAGNPFGVAFGDGKPRVTYGNVSALGCSLTSELDATDTRYYGDLIQTGTPINPGNSGGPLFDLDGRMIGVVTAIVSSSGVTEGAGFAIPIGVRTRGIIDTLVAGEPVRYGYLGVEVPPISSRSAVDDVGQRGARILRINSDQSPAALAELAPNDIIVEFAGVEIEDSDHLIRVVGMTPVGTQAKVRYLREGIPEETVVTLAERPLPHREFQPVAGSGMRTVHWKGVVLAEMNDATLRLHGLTRAKAGLLVTKVDGAVARRAGLRPDDIVLRCNGTLVRNLSEFAQVQAKGPRYNTLELLDGRTVRLPGDSPNR